MVRILIATVLAALAAITFDQLVADSRHRPPGFRHPLRRGLAGLVLGFVLLVSVFFPIAHFGTPLEIDPESLSYAELFFVQALLVLCLLAWYALGFLAVPGVGARRAATAWVDLCGLRTRSLPRELAIGFFAGIGVWLAVLLAALALGLLLVGISGEDELGQEPSALIVWMAGLPVVLRLAISLSAGVAEEIFFRGFLQPRIGVTASTVLFVGAHLSYGEPIMLFGVMLLSVFYARLVIWRGNVWAAIVAHSLFDAVQLLVVIPGVLRVYEGSAAGCLVLPI